MTKQEFQKLTEEGILLLDGATGSNLYKAGMPRGVSTEQWILEHPQVLKDLQRAYVRAGSRIVYAPTFAANSISLKNFGLEKETERLNMELFQVSREAVGHEALVAGDVTTTGKLLEPAGELTYETLVHVYQEQIGVLARAGADLLVLETMMGLEETMAALDAAKSVCDLPVMCTLSLESDGTARFGGGAAEIAETLDAMGASAVGVNCSCGPDQLVSVIRTMRQNASVPIIAKPNAGMPVITVLGDVVYNMTPETFARHMEALVEAGASVIGGCCGTDASYISELRKLCVCSEGQI
ncbi:MAG TPA: homocysteine S-methyltransferase family protein [Candidatus Limivivens intestinipullorum]|uniref:Homocysteine S-methyltransferase family protein n=1 Tax=Candidatus Limivivens intestinipullorum TaxID=2840858 RepID=A0A9D1EV94_9FIRM|nr:homocysteine S-methyltransferase family protein [Candidatus Limivivens intestinipullorum]